MHACLLKGYREILGLQATEKVQSYALHIHSLPGNLEDHRKVVYSAKQKLESRKECSTLIKLNEIKAMVITV